MLQRFKPAFIIFTMLFITITATGAAEKAADVIILNADIRTVDAAQPRAQALAVKDGRFIAVGGNDHIKSFGDDKTQVIDAAGRTLIPGITDAHTHLLGGMDMIQGIDLYGLKSPADWLAAIKKRSDELPKGTWLIGGRWDSNLHIPTAAELDSAAPDRPVALLDLDRHTLWVNSKAMKLTGITARTKAPASGKIIRDSDGRPTGILQENALGLVLDHKAFTNTQIYKAGDYARLVHHFNSLGITGVHDMWTKLADYEAIMKNNSYSLRVWFGLMSRTNGSAMKAKHYTSLAARQKRLNAAMARQEKREGLGPKFRFGYLKYLLDGTLASYTAALNEPYTDRADGFTGKPVKTQTQLNFIVRNANSAGFPVAFHAIGDKTVDMAFAAFAQSPGKKAQYNRIEHIEIATPQAIKRFGRAGVVASMQPNHAMDGDFQEKRLGEKRLPSSYAWRDILSGGALLVFGSDWPTAQQNPMLQIGDAVLRIRNGQPWHSHNALSFDEALHAYTLAPATISGWQNELGSISAGKWADFVILQGTVHDNPMTDIRKWQVEQTWFAGKKVYQRQN